MGNFRRTGGPSELFRDSIPIVDRRGLLRDRLGDFELFVLWNWISHCTKEPKKRIIMGTPSFGDSGGVRIDLFDSTTLSIEESLLPGISLIQ